MLKLREVGSVTKVNNIQGGKEILLYSVVKGTEDDKYAPYISAVSADGENFVLRIVRERSVVVQYDFSPIIKDIIIDRAKRAYKKVK